ATATTSSSTPWTRSCPIWRSPRAPSSRRPCGATSSPRRSSWAPTKSTDALMAGHRRSLPEDRRKRCPMNDLDPLRGLQTLREFPLLDALLGRRSRRFFQGARVPDGVFAYDSRHPPLPLSELETLLVVGACGGCTGWQDLIYRADRYAPHLSNYAAAAGGRTFPSAAGFHTSQVFFTDDTGVYLLDNRDAPPDVEHGGPLGLGDVVAGLRKRVRKLQDGRLGLPPQIPYVEPHNTWVVNHPGTLLVSPVGDLAQHVLLVICYLLQNGYVLTDDV